MPFFKLIYQCLELGSYMYEKELWNSLLKLHYWTWTLLSHCSFHFAEVSLIPFWSVCDSDSLFLRLISKLCFIAIWFIYFIIAKDLWFISVSVQWPSYYCLCFHKLMFLITLYWYRNCFNIVNQYSRIPNRTYLIK